MAADTLAAIAFWVAAGLVVYSYAVYPVLLAALVRLLPRRGKSPVPADKSAPPAVACIVSAFNEERHVAERVANFLAQDSDGAALRVYIGSDGSSDGTARILEGLASDRVVALPFPVNRGKASVLNDLVAASTEPILVFSDANTLFEPGAVKAMLQRLRDPAVGAVCGELRLLGSKGDNQDSLYWRYEQFLKRHEARLGGLLGANGAIYALRRELYRPLRPDTIVDDFCIAMAVPAHGLRLDYAPEAVALEDTPDNIQDEYRRRVRIGIGNFQAFFRHPEYLLGTNWATRFTYLSHKVLRWYTPHFMAVALLASTGLALHSPFYAVLAAGQWALYLLTAMRQLAGSARPLPKLANLLVFFVTLNWAFAVAFWRYVTGRYSGSWRRTERA